VRLPELVQSVHKHEGRKLIPVMESIKVKHGRGRPRKEEAEDPLCGHQVQHTALQVLPGWQAREVTDARYAWKEEASWQTEGVRQVNVRSRQINDRAIQRMDQGVQEGRNEIRETTTGLHGVRPSSVHHGLPLSIATSS